MRGAIAIGVVFVIGAAVTAAVGIGADTRRAKVFKLAEPYAYSWSGDDATSVFTCKGRCDYTITCGVNPPAIGGLPG